MRYQGIAIFPMEGARIAEVWVISNGALRALALPKARTYRQAVSGPRTIVARMRFSRW